MSSTSGAAVCRHHHVIDRQGQPGAGTADVVTQLTAASRALDRAGFNVEEVERLLLSLA